MPTLKQRNRSRRLSSFKELGTSKDLFLKNLDMLFNGSRGSFEAGNTVIVDDNPRKHIMNKPNIVILPNYLNYYFPSFKVYMLLVIGDRSFLRKHSPLNPFNFSYLE